MKVSVDGTQIHAATGGKLFDPENRSEDHTVIFVHGAGFDHTTWVLQSRWFAWHGWSVLAVDLPGHGLSEGDPLTSVQDMAAWLLRFMDAAGVETATLVGHSLGGAVALEAAAIGAARVTRLVMIGAGSHFPVHPDLIGAAKDNDPLAYELMTDWAHGPRAKLGTNTVPGLSITGSARALLARNKPGVLYADMKACDDWDSYGEAASAVTMPSVIVIGSSDIMAPVKSSHELADAIEGCRRITLEGCGHMMMSEAPDAILDILIENL